MNTKLAIRLPSRFVYKSLVNQQIIVMIIRSVYRVAANVNQRLLFGLSTIPMMKFQLFFKQIQKSNSPTQTIRIYEKSRIEHGSSDQFLAVTLRILTRSIRLGENDDPEAVKGFFQRNFYKITKMDLKKMHSQYIKDVIFFYVRFTQHFKLEPDQIQLIKNCLRQFLLRYNLVGDQKALSQYSSVIFFSTALTLKYCRQLNQQFLQLTLKLLSSKPENYIADHDDFQRMLDNLSQFQNYQKRPQRQLVFLIFRQLKNVDIGQHFTEKRILALIFNITKIKKHLFIQPGLLQLLDQVLQKSETALLDNFTKLKLQTFNRLIPVLFHSMRKSPVLIKFFQIFKQSLNSQGRSKIDPRVIVLGSSFIPRQHFTEYFPTNWCINFVKMVQFHHLRNPYFFDGVLEYLFELITSKKLSWNESFNLYKIVLGNIVQSQAKQDKKIIKKLLFASILKAHFIQMSQIQQTLLKINSHFRNYKQQNQTAFSAPTDTIDLYQYYSNICQYQANLHTLLDFPQKQKQMHQLGRAKVKFVTDILNLLFQLKIKLAYFDFSFIQVQKTIQQPQLLKIRYMYNKKKVMQKIMLNCKFSPVHFSAVYSFLLKLNKTQMLLQQNATWLLQNHTYELNQLSASSIKFIYYLYCRNNPKKLIQLMANHSSLLNVLLKYLSPQIVTFALCTDIASSSKGYIILGKIIQYHSQVLFIDEALVLFNQLATKLLPLFISNNDQSFYLYKILINFTLKTFIFQRKQVNEAMNTLSNSLKGKNSSLKTPSESIEDFLQQFQPKIKDYLISSQKMTQQAHLQILKQLGPLSNNLSMLKLYLSILSNQNCKRKIQFSFFFVQLRKIVLQNYHAGLRINILTEIVQFFIKQGLFCSEFNPQFFQMLSNYYASQFTYFSHLSVYPIPKPESLISSYLEEVTLNPLENMNNFCLIYSLIQSPSLQLRQFMAKYVARHRKNMPGFFKVYLSWMDGQVASKVELQPKSMSEMLETFQIKSISQNQILVGEQSVVEIFEKDSLACRNWLNVDTLKVNQGVHLQIARKILKKAYPTKEVRFLLQKQTQIID